MRGLHRVLALLIGLTVLASGVAWVISDGVEASVGTQLASDEVGLVDSTTGQWFLRDGLGRTVSFYYGVGGDWPLVGDWDCDGIDTPGMYRASDGLVYLRNSNATGIADLSFHIGIPGDVPVAGDWDGDGCDTVGVFRDGHVYLTNTLGEEGGWLITEFDFWFGTPGDVPFVGDFDGDGIDEIGLHRLASGFVYLRLTHTTGFADEEFFYGIAGDRLLVGDWRGNGTETVGLYRAADSMFYLRYSNTLGDADEEFYFQGGPPHGRNIPIAGRFGLPVDDVMALPVVGEMSEMWTEMFVIPYGDELDRLGTETTGGGAVFGPDYGAQTPDGTWWILDGAKKRIAHYSQTGDYIDAIDLGPEFLTDGQYFQYHQPRALADGTFVATDLDVPSSTHFLTLHDGIAELATVGNLVVPLADDGVFLYGFVGNARVTIDLTGPTVSATDWFYTQAGSRYRLTGDGTSVRIELPDAVPPVDRVVPIVAASDYEQSLYAGFEAEATSDGNIHLLLFGTTDAEPDVQLAGFTTILPDGSLTPVESIRNPFSDVDAAGAGGNLGVRFGAEQPWMMFVDNDGLRVFQRTTVAGAIYPPPQDLKNLLMSDESPPQGYQVVAGFARDILEIDQPVVTTIGSGGEWQRYQVEGEGLVANVYTRIVAWRPDGTVIRGIASASTLTVDDDSYLSASVRDVDGAWIAQFGFPPVGDSAAVTYASGDWEVSEVTSSGEVTLLLPDVPIENPRLTITHYDGDAVVGFHGTLLPIGKFAAG